MNSGFNYRLYNNNDFDAVYALFRENFKTKKTVECSKKTLHELLNSGKYLVFVVSNTQDVVVGACVVYIHNDPFDTDFATLWYLAVDKEYRNNGLATNLLSFVIGELKGKGLESLRLTTALDNISCQKASENAGFEKRYSYCYMF